jgi:hypothetical protein
MQKFCTVGSRDFPSVREARGKGEMPTSGPVPSFIIVPGTHQEKAGFFRLPHWVRQEEQLTL